MLFTTAQYCCKMEKEKKRKGKPTMLLKRFENGTIIANKQTNKQTNKAYSL